MKGNHRLKTSIVVLVAASAVLVAPVGAQGPALPARTTVTHALVSIGASSAVALAANDARNYIRLQGTHATQVLDCKFGATAVAGEGFRVPANFGTPVIFDVRVPLGVLNCIGSGAGTGMTVTEGSIR